MKKKLLFLIPAFVGMSVFAQAQQKVGVNTTAPQATLDINGNMAIEKVRNADESESVAPLGWDSSDKKVKQLIIPDHLIYSLDYRVECTTGGQKSQKNQWVANFDTKIPYDKFNVIFGRVLPVDRDYERSKEIDILHSDRYDDGGGRRFERTQTPNIQILDYPYAEKHSQTNETYSGSDDNKYYVNPVLRKVLWKDDHTKTWHMSVGYVDARPNHAVHHTITYEWNVQLLALTTQLSESKDMGLRKVSDPGGNSNNTIDFQNDAL